MIILQNKEPDKISGIVTMEAFKNRLQEKLGEFYPRAVVIFSQYGEKLSPDVANVLLHASDKGSVEEVLEELEKHWDEDLSFQNPDIRGTALDRFGANRTMAMFVGIILKMQTTQKKESSILV